MLGLNFDPDWASPGEWALAYRSRLLQVVPAYFPDHKNPAFQYKRPCLPEWKQLQDGLVPDLTFYRWYGPGGEHATRQQMGFLTGACSGNVGIIDLDDQKTASADFWWRGLLSLHNNEMDLETWEQVTGGGGRQLAFRFPEGFVIPTIKTAIGVDIRGQGGFAMLPPSIHASGKHYQWKLGREPWEAELKDAPEWLCDAVLRLWDEYGGSSHVGRQKTSSGPRQTNEWGKDIDNREEKMTRLIWRWLVDLARDAPMISESHLEQEMQKAWAEFERTTASRIDGAGSNADRLEREGRGLSEFRKKWRYAATKWDTDIAEAAKQEPSQGGPEPASESTLGTEEQAKDDPIFVGDLSGEPAPRQWFVKDWIPAGAATILSGDGGTGKTLIGQQLLYSSGLGEQWLGVDVTPTRGLGIFCEDDEDELHRRHNDIKTHLGHPVGNPFTDTWIWPRVGFDNLLVTFDKNNLPTLSPFFERIRRHVLDNKVGFLVLDNAADLFGGNEIIRAQVNFFIKAVVGSFIKDAKAAGWTLTVLLLAHPSQAGRNSGTGESGSTAWNNAVRSRLYLTRDEMGGTNDRVLTRKKSNYSAAGDDEALSLHWADGVLALRSQGDSSGLPPRDVCRAILAKLRDQWAAKKPWSNTTESKAAGRYAPELIARSFPVSRASAERLLHEWLIEDLIAIDMVDTHSKMKGFRVNGSI